MIRLVIVDDMPDIRNYLAEELAAASEQFSVVGAAEDGTEAVKLVDSLLPDVVLMDIQMKTRTEGIYAIRIIHERHPDIKCIALTIHEDDELIFQAYLAGAADYIIKTRSIDTIKNSILAVVNNRLLLRPEVGQRLIQEYQRVQNQENRMKETMQVMLKINRRNAGRNWDRSARPSSSCRYRAAANRRRFSAAPYSLRQPGGPPADSPAY